MSTTLEHTMTPTADERAAVAAGLAKHDQVEWRTNDAGQKWLDRAQEQALAEDPDVIRAAQVKRDWERRTCPSWCTVEHDSLSAFASFNVFHRVAVDSIATTEARMDIDVEISAFYTEDAVDGSVMASGPEVELTANGESFGLTGTQARRLAAALLNAADQLDEISR